MHFRIAKISFVILASSLLWACGEEAKEPKGLAKSCEAGVCQGLIRSIDFGLPDDVEDITATTEDDVVFGFDLDGVASEQGDTEGCGIEDRIAPDGRTGIDNQLGVLLKEIGSVVSIVDELVQDSINEGGVLYMPEIEGFFGYEDDEITGRMLDVDSRPLVGNDNFVIRGQTVELDPNPVMSELKLVRNGNSFESAEPFSFRMPVEILDVDEELRVENARLRFTLDENGDMIDGLMGGGLVIADILNITENYAVGDEVRALVPVLLNSLADIEDEEGECSQLSVALKFEAVKAFGLAATGTSESERLEYKP